MHAGNAIPDGQDAAGLCEVGLLLDATDALLKNGGDLGRGGLVRVRAGLGGGDRRGDISLLRGFVSLPLVETNVLDRRRGR